MLILRKLYSSYEVVGLRVTLPSVWIMFLLAEMCLCISRSALKNHSVTASCLQLKTSVAFGKSESMLFLLAPCWTDGLSHIKEASGCCVCRRC